MVNHGVAISPPVPISSDVGGFADFHYLQNQLSLARSEFLELPAHVRARFHNDPGEFYEFFHNESNRDEAFKLGFLAPREPEKIVKVDVVDTVDRRAAAALKKAQENVG